MKIKESTKSHETKGLIIFILLFLYSSLQIFLFLADITKGYVVDVSVVKKLDGEITSFYYNSSTDLVKFRIEFQNRGSIAHTARIRIDIFNTSDINNTSDNSFTIWDVEKIFMPGDKKSSELYWYTDEVGNFTSRVRVYYANEILERYFEVEKNKSIISPYTESEDIFKIKEFRTYNNFVIFDLISEIDTKDIVIIPTRFTKGWIFEQKKIDFLTKEKAKTIVLPYHAPVYAEDSVSLLVVSDESKFYTKEAFELIKKGGLEGLIFRIIDNLKIFLSH